MCIALIESSVGVLLHCLEMVDYDSAVREGFLAWEVNDGVKCASFLRRIYEEVRVCICFVNKLILLERDLLGC